MPYSCHFQIIILLNLTSIDSKNLLTLFQKLLLNMI